MNRREIPVLGITANFGKYYFDVQATYHTIAIVNWGIVVEVDDAAYPSTDDIEALERAFSNADCDDYEELAREVIGLVQANMNGDV